jgi:hypothetical protein
VWLRLGVRLLGGHNAAMRKLCPAIQPHHDHSLLLRQ